MNITILTILFSSLILSGCSQTESTESVSESLSDNAHQLARNDSLVIYSESIDETESQYQVEFTRDLVFDSPPVPTSTNVGFGPRKLISVDDTGRVFVGASYSVGVFNTDGEYLTQVGREGSGPGEFRSLMYIQPKIHSDYLFAADEALQRINVYSLDTFENVHTVLFNPDSWSHIEALRGRRLNFDDYYILGENTVLMAFDDSLPLTIDELQRGLQEFSGEGWTLVESNTLYFLFDYNGSLLSDDSVVAREVIYSARDRFNLKAPVDGRLFPFVRSEILEVSDNGSLFLTKQSEDFSVHVYSMNGDNIHAFFYSHNGQLLDREEIIQKFYSTQPESAVQNLELPESLPAFDYLMIDDQERLWIGRLRANDNQKQQWWVLEADGTLLARFTWPVLQPNENHRQLQFVKGEYLYVNEPKIVDGFPEEQLVRYKFTFTPFKNTN